jgi:hypothetical protein
VASVVAVQAEIVAVMAAIVAVVAAIVAVEAVKEEVLLVNVKKKNGSQ